MDVALSPLLFFDPADANVRERAVARRTERARERARRLYCARCRHPISDERERVTVNGGHTHTCTNPYGITYRIGCFRSAPGCAADGTPTLEHTWFSGYAWQVAYCRGCDTHLGWLFTGADAFYGLIVDRLTTAGSS